MSDLYNDRKRIVITGLGVVCSAGRTIDQFWSSLARGRTQSEHAAATTPSSMAMTPGVADFSGTIEDFPGVPDTKRQAIRKGLKLMNRETRLGVAAGQQALADAGTMGQFDPQRFGVCFGADNVSVMPEDFQRGITACSSTAGEFDFARWGTEGLEQIAPLWILKCLPNMPACHLAIINDLQGPTNTITQRDVSANIAIAEACRGIRSGELDAALVGATGTTLHAFGLMHAQLEDEVAGNVLCRPFDKRRTGSAPGEGAAAIVLEDAQSALRRGAPIYGEVVAWGASSCVGSANRTGKSEIGGTSAGGRDTTRSRSRRKAMASALRQTIRRAGWSPANVGHIHAHGLGTWQSDIAEAQAIGEVFGESGPIVPIVAAKSYLGNSAAGAGMLELVSSVLSLKYGHLFPVLNYEVPDPACAIRPVVDCDEPAGTSFLNLNAFGRGVASCVAISTWAA